jgi:hypothetical protein
MNAEEILARFAWMQNNSSWASDYAAILDLVKELTVARAALEVVRQDCWNLTEKVIPNLRAERDEALERQKDTAKNFYHVLSGLHVSLEISRQELAEARAALKDAEFHITEWSPTVHAEAWKLEHAAAIKAAREITS